MLSDEICEFLIESDIYCFLSIDGSAEHHNANRVFENGKGSFDIVSHNIDKLIEISPDYCKSRIMLQAVSADNIDKRAAIEYILEKYSKQVLQCTAYKQNYWHNPQVVKQHPNSFNYESFENLCGSLENMTAKEIEILMTSDKDKIALFKDLFSLEKYLVFDNPSGTNRHHREFSCPIGIDAIFCASDGNLHICNKSDYSFPIGDIWGGVDTSKVFDLYKKYYTEINATCKNCWAFRFCKTCPASVLLDSEFHIARQDLCEDNREMLERRIMRYIILVHYPNAYDLLKEHYLLNKKETFLNFEGSIYKQ